MKERFIMRKFDSKRKGFTLVELLIVIVVIGILSAMMMLSSSEAVSSARATTIVADLRNIKTAALAYYTDHMDDYATSNTVPTMDKIKPYLTSGQDVTGSSMAGYDIKQPSGDNVDAWFVHYSITGTNIAKIKEKLTGRAKSVGILKDMTTKDSTTNTYNGYYDGTGTDVYMLIR